MDRVKENTFKPDDIVPGNQVATESTIAVSPAWVTIAFYGPTLEWLYAAAVTTAVYFLFCSRCSNAVIRRAGAETVAHDSKPRADGKRRQFSRALTSHGYFV